MYVGVRPAFREQYILTSNPFEVRRPNIKPNLYVSCMDRHEETGLSLDSMAGLNERARHLFQLQGSPPIARLILGIGLL